MPISTASQHNVKCHAFWEPEALSPGIPLEPTLTVAPSQSKIDEMSRTIPLMPMIWSPRLSLLRSMQFPPKNASTPRVDGAISSRPRRPPDCKHRRLQWGSATFLSVQRLGVLASGSGTILQALLDSGLPVAVVVVDRPCAATGRAEAAGIPLAVVERTPFLPDFLPRAHTHPV